MLGGVLKRQRKLEEAESAFRKSLQIKLKHFPADHWQVATTQNLLGDCLTDQEAYTAAEPLLIESVGIIEKQFGASHERTRVATTRAVTLYERWGKPAQAAEWRARLPKEGAK